MRFIFAAAALLAAPAGLGAQSPAPRPVIRTPADLPQTRHPTPEAPSAFSFSDAFLRDLLPRLRADAERVLATSDFADLSLRRQLAGGTAAIALLQDRPADADRIIADQRAREVQPQLRALALLNLDGLSGAAAAGPQSRCEAGGTRLAERLTGVNPLEARQEITRRWAQLRLSARPFEAAGLQSVDREAPRLGGVTLLEGLQMALTRLYSDRIPPCRDTLASPLRRWLDDPRNAEPDIWTVREPAAATFAGARPVTVAIWDSGLDYSLFAGQLAVDPAEPLDGRDNDRNGVVDDVHGPTFDVRINPSNDGIPRLSDPLKDRYSVSSVLLQGERELVFGFDTPAARLFTEFARTASAEEQALDLRLGGEVNDRAHGTFVASQVAEGLPFVRLYNVRLAPFGYEPDRVYTSEPEMQRWIAQLAPTVRRMRGAGVRVVNMSWVYTDDGGERLIRGGFETDPERARQRSRRMYEDLRSAMASAFAEAPDILFVVAAGNDGSDNEAIKPLPHALGLPNFLVVGAVGRGGAAASFTSFGDGVSLYSNGGLARGLLPGGTSSWSTGTSMAAPLVARTAAQMLAVNPRLSPAQLIAGLEETATANAQNLRLIHPAAAVEWARRQAR